MLILLQFNESNDFKGYKTSFQADSGLEKFENGSFCSRGSPFGRGLSPEKCAPLLEFVTDSALVCRCSSPLRPSV